MRQREGLPFVQGCQGCPSELDPCLWSGSGDNPAHLIVVADRPSGFSIGRSSPFFGPTGRLFYKMLAMITKYQSGRYSDLKVYTTYGVLAGNIDPTAEHIRYCQPNLHRELAKIKGVDGGDPVIIGIGEVALRSLGIPMTKITNMVGRVLTTIIKTPQGDRKFNVIPVFDLLSVKKKPGLANVTVAAMLQATRLAMKDITEEAASLDELTKDYVFPKTPNEVKELVDHIVNYCDEDSSLGPQHWVVALDTETNSLHAHLGPSKMLMLSVAWDVGKAATILLDHPEVPYDPKEVRPYVDKLLSSPKPKVFHNWKFDRKFLEERYGYGVNRVVWDTMLGEHYLDEDKKGMYGLKKLTGIYAPGYVGYDDELQEILRGASDKDTDAVVVDEADVATLAIPSGRDKDQWKELISVIAERGKEKAKPIKQRDKKLMTDKLSRIKQLYKMLDLEKPSRKKKKKDDGGFEDIPLEIILKYAAVDADVTRIILKGQNQRLLQTKTLEEGRYVMKYLYLPGSKTLSEMEHRGVNIDLPYLDEVEEKVTTMLVETEKKLRSDFASDVNFSSPSQVSEFMTKMNFEIIDGATPGSTSKDVLDRYVDYYDIGDPRYEFASTLLTFRAAHKAKTGFLRKIRKLSAKDGRIHGSFNLAGTATGRLSSANPNMQNYPSYMCRIVRKDKNGKDQVIHPGFNIKKVFIPSNPDYTFVNADIKAAELRVYTAYSRDEKMIQALLDGLDVHSFTASKINDLPYEKVEVERHVNKEIKKMRDIAKRVVFGTFYGAGAYKIAEQIGCSKEEAQRIIDLLFSAFPALRLYIENTKAQVRNKQFVKTHFGRCRRFRLARADRQLYAEACREAVNFLIQSTASDLVLGQLCEVSDNLHKLDGRMLLTVHDSMTFEIPKSVVDVQEVDGKLHEKKGLLHEFLDEWVVKRVADKYDWLPVPFLYDVEIGPSYGEVREVERWKTV